MGIGEKIAAARKAKKWTQEDLAWKTQVSVAAVSAWETGKSAPDKEHMVALSGLLGLSLEELLADMPAAGLAPGNPYFDPEHMYTFVKGRAQMLELKQTLAALPVMRERHRKVNQKRRSKYGFENVYEVHPLTLACHALALGIREDGVLAACLLHDVVEDTGISPEGLMELIPVLSEKTLKIVRLVSKNQYDRRDPDWEKEYYDHIRESREACLVKVLDRVNNLGGMADAFDREWMIKYIHETEKYYPDLLEVLKKSEWNDAWWLLRYQIVALLESYKRLL